jgi:predicted dehydrogenase
MVSFYKAAIIGTGRIGFSLQFDKKREQPAAHSPAFYKNKNIKLVAACDIDEKKLVKWKTFYKKGNIYKNIETLFENEKPDIVIIAVNENAHLETTLKCIEQRPKLIVLEKPVAPDLKSAKLIKKYAEQFNVPISVNHERRFSSDYKLVKEMINSGKLGSIHTVKANLWSGATVYKKSAEEDGSCSLIHDGTHLVDIIHFLFDIELKKPITDNIIFDNKKDVRSINIHYTKKLKNEKNEILIYIEMNGNKKYFGFEIEINGSIGKIIIGNGYLKFYESKVSPYYSGFYSLVKNKKLKTPEKTGYFSNMVQNCVDYLAGKENLISPLEEGIKTLKVLYDIVDIIKR